MNATVLPAAEDRAYQAIRAGIVGGAHGDGTHLNAADIAADLGISRTPVREALRRLHSEGLVTLIANRGAYVTPWTHDDLDEVFSLRVLLEGHAAALAARRVSDAQMAALRDLATGMEAALAGQAPDHVQAVAALNAQFHRGIVAASGQRRLSMIMASIVDTPLILRTFTVYAPDDMRRSMEHHRELIAAFAAGDAEWAACTMRSHMHAARQVLLRHGTAAAAHRAGGRPS